MHLHSALYTVNYVHLTSRAFETRDVFSGVTCFKLKRVLAQQNSLGCWLVAWLSLFGAFARLRKATVSFLMSVRPPARMEQLGSHWTDFHEI